MLTNTRRSNILSRSIPAMLATAALAALGGCASSESSDSMDTNASPSVTAAHTTHEQSSASEINSTRSFPTGDHSSSVLTMQVMGPQSVRLNRQASYQVKVTNLLDMPVKNVVVTTTNPDGFQTTAVSGSTTQPADGGRMDYSLGNFAAKESKTMTVTGMATKVGSVDTCYSIRYNPPTLCTAMQVTNPALALTVQAPSDTDICKPVVYQYTVTNTGTGTAHNVILQEELPTGLMTTDNQQSVMAKLGDIPQGENRTALARLKASKTGSFAGKAIARSDDDSSPTASTSTAVHAPMLAVAVTGGASDYIGKQVAYHITVTNKGDAPANNTKLQVGHPVDGVGLIAAEGADANGMVTIGTLAPNASKTIDAQASSNKGGTLMVVANASADCASPVSGNASTMFNTIPALLLETVDEVDPVKVGDNVIYDIKVTNQGSGPDTNVNVKAMVPDGEQYLSTDGPTQPSASGSTLTFPIIPALQSKESVTWKVTLKAVKAQDVQFKTTVTSDGIKAGAEKAEPTKLY